jgi:hypothetical protein
MAAMILGSDKLTAWLGTTERVRFSMASLLLAAAAIPIWVYVIRLVGASPVWGTRSDRYALPLFVLAGVAAALHHPLRRRANGWAIALFAAPLLVFAVLSLVAALHARYG